MQVTRTVHVPQDELALRFSRSGGPGGQHVNTSATKVELRFDLGATASLDERQKALVRQRLGSRLTDDDVLILTSSEHRSQARNREAVLARFRTLLADALRTPRPRTSTRPPAAARRRRLEAKRRRAETKSLRRRPEPPT